MSPTNTITAPSEITSPQPSLHREYDSSIELRFITNAALSDRGRRLSEDRPNNIDPAEFLPQPSTTVSVVERWNSPKGNIYRTSATLFAFVIMGANDAAYGVSTCSCLRRAISIEDLSGHHSIPRGVLQLELRDRIASLPITPRRLCRRGASQQLDSRSFRPAWSCLPRTTLSRGSICWDCSSSAIPSLGGYFHCCRVW